MAATAVTLGHWLATDVRAGPSSLTFSMPLAFFGETMIPVSTSTLSEVGQTVPVPLYERGDITVGIVHFGVGAFHRAHEAMFIDRLLREGEAREWGICGVGLLPSDTLIRDVLKKQDNLYTLVEKTLGGTTEPRIIGSIVEYLFAPDDPDAVLDRLSSPATRIVSLTVTEGGYRVNDATGEFDPTSEDITSDLQSGTTPRSLFGYLTEALRRRRDNGVAPFTVVSCDNMQDNGKVAKVALTSFARMKDPALAQWITENVEFPSSMVDRITPKTTDGLIRELETTYGVKDEWPVVSETYEQWIVEDRFACGRPPLERVGVQLVEDVIPFELMKIRLLNAAHQVMSYLGILAGYTYVHEVCRDQDFVDFLLGYMTDEATPTLNPVPGTDFAEYSQRLMSRFHSDAIADTLARQTVDGSQRIPKFLLPVLREQLATGGSINHIALVVAAWGVYLEGTDEFGRAIAIDDALSESLADTMKAETDNPGALLDRRDIFGDLGQNNRFRTTYLDARQLIKSAGAVYSVRTLNHSKSSNLT